MLMMTTTFDELSDDNRYDDDDKVDDKGMMI